MATTPAPKPTPAQNKAWLDTHPNWKAVTAARWALKNPDAQVSHRPGIGQTVKDYQTLAKALSANAGAYGKAANSVANSMFNSAQTSAELRPQDTAQRQQNVTDFGNELLKQLAGISLASADQTQGNINLFKQGATAADQATSAQAVAAGGTTAPSTVDPAAVSLGNTGANLLNAFAGRQTAAADQNRLFHQQETLNTRAGLDKLTAQKKSDYQTEYDHQQSAGDSRVANAMTYNLYNQQNTTRSKIAGGKLSVDIAKNAETKAYHAAMRAIAQQNADTKRWLADGTYTPKTAARAASGAAVIKNAFDKFNGTGGGKAGTKVYLVPYSLPGAPTGQYTTDSKGNAVPVTATKTGVYKATEAQYQAFLHSANAGTRNMGVFGLKGATRTGPITPSTTAGTAAGVKWKMPQVKAYLKQSGLLTDTQISAVLAALTDPNKAAKLLSDPSFWNNTPTASGPVTP